MRRQSISSSLLPVIDEGVGSGGEDDSSHSSSISSHCHHLRLGDTVSHCVVWPPIGFASWPPPSDHDHDDHILENQCEQQTTESTTTTSYGSLPLSKELRPHGDKASTGAPSFSSPLLNSHGISSLANNNNFRQEVSGSHRRSTHRSLLIATLAFTLMAVAIWLPVLTQEPADSYTSTVSYSAEPWGQSKVVQPSVSGIEASNENDDDDDDDDDKVIFFTHPRKSKSKHYASSSSSSSSPQSTIPFYRRSYDNFERGGKGEKSIHVFASRNSDGNNATVVIDIDNGVEEPEEGKEQQQQEYDMDPILQSELSSTSLSSDINFADLAGMMLPIYFQKTVRLCISTIKPATINDTSFDEGSNVTTASISRTTSVMPGDVFKLRKTMLKTRDMLDVFSTVYSTQSSLDDYSDKKYNDALLKMHFEPWKKVNMRGERIFESNYLNSGMDDTNNISDAEQQNGRRMRRRPPHNEIRPKIKDLWYTLRKFLDRGYTLIGDFQDLDHAKIMHSSAQLAQYQLQVWQWCDEFMTYVTKNRRHITLYLSLPCKTRKEKKNKHQHHCRYVHSHTSHLFWGSIHSERDLPDGNIDKATYVLGRLGYMQLGRAQAYLVDVLTREHVISTMTTKSGDDAQNEADGSENEVHETYHNLRKELRSFLDELDLFGDLLLPNSSIVPESLSDRLSAVEDEGQPVLVSPSSSPTAQTPTSSPTIVSSTSSLSVQVQTDQAVDVLRNVRNILGDLNDSYVAYAKYREWDEYLEERLELQQVVETQWGQFRAWAKDVNLIGKLNFLMGEIDPSPQDLSAHDDDGSIRE
jgi:hypothetical protein